MASCLGLQLRHDPVSFVSRSPWAPSRALRGIKNNTKVKPWCWKGVARCLATLFYFFKILLLIHSLALKTPVLLFGNDIIMARCRAVILAYLPNKKILFLLVFILLIFAGWFYFSDYKNKQIQYIAEQEKSPLAVVLEQTSQLDADSDADGLKDWEELLWKTDPNKEDTDGDGINDNEEITLNRNPLKAGPNDKISEKEDLVAQEKAVSDSNQNTLTAAYARKFLTEYLLKI